ncbi:MAG: hypothetical protein H0Z28_06335 [Archaeoglobus sp.]|nr:hypothetical protein [Archaeoglobus sp.]
MSSKYKIYTIISAVLFSSLWIFPASAEEWNLIKLTENDVDDKFSPYGMTADGRIVYITDTDGNYATIWDREVFMMDLETLEVERITDNLHQDLCAAVSADGSKVAFVEIEPISDTDEVRVVYVVSESNGWNQSYPITASYGYSSTCPLLSADGRYLTFYEMFSGTDHDRFRVFDMITRNQKGAYTSVYGFYNWMVQSLDKSKIAYLEYVPCGNDKECQRLHVMSTTPPFSDKIIYTTTGVEKILIIPSISNDGKVAFYMESEFPGEGAKKGVFLYENGNIRLLTPTERPVVPVISGDGSKVFYFEKKSGREKVYRINTDGSGKELVVTIGNVWTIGTPVANYDGSKVVFMLERWNDDFDIYMISQQTMNLPGINIEFFPAFPPMTSVVVASAKATRGDVVQIPIEIKNANNVGSVDIVLSYPSGILQFMDVIPGSLTQNSLFEHNVEDGKIRVGIVETGGISGDGSLFYMKFRVAENPQVSMPENLPQVGKEIGVGVEGLTPNLPGLSRGNEYNLVLEDLAVYTTDNQEVNALKINGTFELISEEEANKGDVNGDGEITSVDALMALQMAVGKLEPKPVADMDDDGNVRANDAMEIMKIATQNMMEKTYQMIQQGIKKPKFPFGG